MKKKLSVEWDDDAGYAIVKIDWADRFAPANWKFWTDKVKHIIGVGNLSGILCDDPEIISPTTAVIRYTIVDHKTTEEADAI